MMKDYPLSIVFIIYCIGVKTTNIFIYFIKALVFVFSLFCYHTYLIIINETTNENLKKSWIITSGNPYKLLVFIIFIIF